MRRVTIKKVTQKFSGKAPSKYDTVYRVNVNGRTQRRFATKSEAKRYADRIR